MEHDLIVVGGGLIGASFARAARGSRVALVDPAAPASSEQARVPEDLDSRIYALSPGSVAFLEQIKAWQEIAPERKCAVRSMRVRGDDAAACLEFDAYDAGVPELAWIVEERELRRALWQALATQDAFVHFAGSACTSLEADADAVHLALADGRRISARLVVGADGARSFVRGAARIEVSERSYAQSAVVANFSCARPHFNIAFQWFQGGPVLALLPLSGERVSMVWSTGEAQAAQLMAASPKELAHRVEQATGSELGALELITPARVFPLHCVSATRCVAPRVALIGDAAHVIHPLAGQGANLGFQDARVLAEVVAGAGTLRDIGELRLLRRYERSRREAVLAMRATVNGLFELFGAESGALRRLRNIGLNLTGSLPVLRNVLARRALA
ncbi:MAG: UbiH/UbiF family hydroxylase [Betaproteobacteria bacterium]|nr:UbiH/UbiF family hydroxylase [Betaproteobacteria bacterium]